MREQIDNRNELLMVLEEELIYLDSLVQFQKNIVHITELELDSLQSEYGEMMREALRQKLQDSRLQFILSGSSLTEYYNRWRFLKAYQENRKRQLELILKQKTNLEKELESLELLFQEKESLMAAEQYQNDLLAVDMTMQANTLNALKKDEQELRNELQKYERNKRELDQNIQAVINAGIASANGNKKSRSSVVKDIPENISSFAKAKGKLSWPVKNGVVVKKFGTQKHPTLRGITISNNGIDIRSKPASEVRSVFEGQVLQARQFTGNEYILVIGHGLYYTVYSNLVAVNVKKGDQVELGQVIGYLNGDPTKVSDLHFEIWKEKQKLNPEKWIMR